jgi:hypothetical protein
VGGVGLVFGILDIEFVWLLVFGAWLLGQTPTLINSKEKIICLEEYQSIWKPAAGVLPVNLFL